jgi:hypothetical protein
MRERKARAGGGIDEIGTMTAERLKLMNWRLEDLRLDPLDDLGCCICFAKSRNQKTQSPTAAWVEMWVRKNKNPGIL